MHPAKTIGATVLAGLLCLTVQAQLIDDFSGDLSAYTATRILKASGSGNNVYSWQISGGSLQIDTTTYDGIEQFALTRIDVSLSVGYELTAAYSHQNLGLQDIGLYVGAGHPSAGVRADYVNIYMRNNGQLYSRGFTGTTELSLSGGSSPAVESLFIARTAPNDFELGWYEGGVRNVLVTRTMSNTDIGNAIGFYADVRGAGTRGNLDNLTIALIPEPSTCALLGLAGIIAWPWLRRRK